MATVWTLALGFAGMMLTLRVFGAIMSGEAYFLAWRVNRAESGRRFAVWMWIGALVSLLLYLAALKVYLGPLWHW